MVRASVSALNMAQSYPLKKVKAIVVILKKTKQNCIHDIEYNTLSYTIINNVNFKVHNFWRHLFLPSHFDFRKPSGKIRLTRELSQIILDNQNILKGRNKTVYSY